MAVKPSRVVLFVIGLLLAAGIVGYGTGMFGNQGRTPAETIAALPSSSSTLTPSTTSPSASPDPSSEGAVPAAATPDGGNASPSPAASSPSGTETPAAQSDQTQTAAGALAPKFDVLRVEGDGSVVVAGSAPAGAEIEIVSGATLIGKGQTNAEGDFAIVLDEPLEPGDYSLVLRATGTNGSATSMETAVVSVPENADGQVLAMVEQPGEASRLITVPEAEGAAATPQPNGQASTTTETETPPADEGAVSPPAATEPVPAQQSAAAAPSTETESAASTANRALMRAPAVEAVEIEGARIYVAGRAEQGARLRVYANDILLGETRSSAGGRFLLEANRALPVGEYTIRVDSIASDGSSVIARAAVPFTREPGESIAAVAPLPDAAPSTTPPPSGDPKAAPMVPAPAGTLSGEAPPALAGNSTDGSAASNSAAESASPSTTTEAGSQSVENRMTAETNQPSGDAVATAPKLQAAQGAVIIRRGDSLWRISKRAYGRGVRYSTIYLANQDQIADPDRIWPGQIFRMPTTTTEGETADMGQLGDQATTTE